MLKNQWITLCGTVLVVTLMACGGGDGTSTATDESSTPEPTGAPAGGTGSVTGTVNYANGGDPDAVIKMDADPVCASLHSAPVETETVIAGDGTLGNVFVYVKEGLTGSYPAPAERHVLNQEGCKYSPHVSGIMVGQKLVIRNSDPTLHNVHALPSNNDEFNQGQPFQGMELEKEFENTEVMVRFKCDVHPWMSAHMGVLDHPFFAVTEEDGSFTIANLPAGDYVLEAWHETLGTQTVPVSVAEDGAAEVAFEYTSAG